MPDPLADVSADELFGSGIGFARAGDLWRAEQYLVASMEKGKPRGLVLRTAPNDPMTHYFLGMLYVEDLSDIPAGDPLLARYVELAPEGQHAPEVRALLRRLRSPRSSIERIDSDAVPSPEASVPPSSTPVSTPVSTPDSTLAEPEQPLEEASP